MKFKKILLAAFAGSITMFIWGTISHMFLITGIGYKPLPNESKIMQTLKDTISEKGLYFFPGKDFKNTTSDEEKQWLNKYENGPVGLVIYRPIGGNPFSVNKLIVQYLAYLLSSFLSLLVLANSKGSYWKNVLTVSLIGLIGCLSVSVIYWNWYEYPNSFIAAQFADITIGFFLLGLVISKFKLYKNNTKDYEYNEKN
jgi:hypothetical protein